MSRKIVQRILAKIHGAQPMFANTYMDGVGGGAVTSQELEEERLLLYCATPLVRNSTGHLVKWSYNTVVMTERCLVEGQCNALFPSPNVLFPLNGGACFMSALLSASWRGGHASTNVDCGEN